jgi:hypothetical protein
MHRRPRQPRSTPPTRTHRAGFTLIETALATIIVGVGVLAIMAAQQAFHQKNAWSTHASTALRLGNEIREMTLNLPRHDPVTGASFWGPEPNETWIGDFDDLDDFDGESGEEGEEGEGVIFSASLGNGPVNAMRKIIPNMEGWSQTVTVTNVNPFDITEALDAFESDMIKVDVVIHYQGPTDLEAMEMTRVTWIAPN